MARPAIARGKILALLRERGKMTREELAEELAMSVLTVKGALRGAHKDKQIYVADWFTPPVDEHGKQRAMYALGNRPDVAMMIKTPSDWYRRYREKNYAKVLIKEEIRRRGPNNPFTQLITQCRSAPKKQRNARA